MDRLKDAREAATAIGMSPSWLRREARAQRVECHRFGDRYLFSDDQIAAIKEAHRQPVAPRIPTLRVLGLAVPAARDPGPPKPKPKPRPPKPPKSARGAA